MVRAFFRGQKKRDHPRLSQRIFPPMTSIATRTGDDGNTSLFGGNRVAKNDPRVEAYGNVDELNCWIGLVRAGGLEPESDRLLLAVQSDLFQLGAELATRREGNPHAAKVAPFG